VQAVPEEYARFKAFCRLGDVPERLSAYVHCIASLRSVNGSISPAKAVDWVYSNGARFIRPAQQREEIKELLAILEAARPRTLVEIGTASGGTLFLLSRVAAPDATLVSIDLPGGRFGGGYGRWRSPLYRSFARQGQEVHLIRADSHEPRTLRQLQAMIGLGRLDFLFIDGDHTYEGVRRDFELYGPLMSVGGWIGFHDIIPDPSDAMNEVHRFWEEIKFCYPHREIVSDRNRKYGIGLIRIGADDSQAVGVIERTASGNPCVELRS
jgi:predicted O-methyltransferase YrrM